MNKTMKLTLSSLPEFIGLILNGSYGQITFDHPLSDKEDEIINIIVNFIGKQTLLQKAGFGSTRYYKRLLFIDNRIRIVHIKVISGFIDGSLITVKLTRNGEIDSINDRKLTISFDQ